MRNVFCYLAFSDITSMEIKCPKTRKNIYNDRVSKEISKPNKQKYNKIIIRV